MPLVYFNHVVHVTLVSYVMVGPFHPHPMKTVLPLADVLVKGVRLVGTVPRVHMNHGDVRLVRSLIPKDK